MHSEINYEHILCSRSVVQQLIACLANLMVFHQAAAARWDARCGHRRFHGRDTPTDGDACGCRHKGRDDEANLTCSWLTWMEHLDASWTNIKSESFNLESQKCTERRTLLQMQSSFARWFELGVCTCDMRIPCFSECIWWETINYNISRKAWHHMICNLLLRAFLCKHWKLHRIIMHRLQALNHKILIYHFFALFHLFKDIQPKCGVQGRTACHWTGSTAWHFSVSVGCRSGFSNSWGFFLSTTLEMKSPHFIHH